MSLTGKVALIPGGVKNLGAQTAHELAAQGVSLALHYHSSGSQSATYGSVSMNGRLITCPEMLARTPTSS